MKPIAIILTFSFFLSINLSAQKPAQKKPSEKKDEFPLPPLKLKTVDDSVQYALGAYMGRYMLDGGFTTINLDLFLAGLDAIFNRKPRLISDSSVLNILTTYQKEAQKKLGKLQEDQMFALLKDMTGVVKLPGGVQYIVVRTGNGPHPLETDSVLIHFEEAAANGTIIENTYASNKPILVTPATLIPGLKQVLPLMQAGARWRVFIPSTQAYGDYPNGLIPPNSALAVQIEILEIKKKKQ